MAGGLKFRIKEVEGLYYPSSENKGVDQLRGYREADLRLCFRKCKKPVFSQRGSNGFDDLYIYIERRRGQWLQYMAVVRTDIGLSLVTGTDYGWGGGLSTAFHIPYAEKRWDPYTPLPIRPLCYMTPLRLY